MSFVLYATVDTPVGKFTGYVSGKKPNREACELEMKVLGNDLAQKKLSTFALYSDTVPGMEIIVPGEVLYRSVYSLEIWEDGAE